MVDYRDRRKNSRFRVRNCVVRYAETDFRAFRDEFADEHQLLDLSLGGMKFVASDRLPMTGQMQISLHVPAYEQPLSISGTVAWCRAVPKQDGLWLVGISFTHIPERSRQAMLRMEKDGKLRSLQKIIQLPESM